VRGNAIEEPGIEGSPIALPVAEQT
jgi:hypothetical protein